MVVVAGPVGGLVQVVVVVAQEVPSAAGVVDRILEGARGPAMVGRKPCVECCSNVDVGMLVEDIHFHVGANQS